MSWNIIWPQISTLLQTLTKIQYVSETPEFKFSGYPAATVTASENSGDYETTSENERIYAFDVRVFYETKDSGVDAALKALREVVDDVIDAFDQEDLKGADTRTLGMNLPAKYTFLNVFATPSQWGEVQGEQLVYAELKLKIRLSVDIT